MHGGVWTAGGKVDEGGGSTQSVGHHPAVYTRSKRRLVIEPLKEQVISIFQKST